MKSVQAVLLAIVFFCCLAAWSQSPEKQPKLEYFNPNLADRSIDPCQDFYQFACNKWFAANPIPPTRQFGSPEAL